MNTTLSRKIQKVLEIKLDSPELVDSLNELTTFYSNNSINARRNLRNDIERRALDINIQFLDQFTALNKCIEDIQLDYEDIKKGFSEVRNHLSQSKSSFSNVLQEAKKLSYDLKEIEEKEKMVNDFLVKFKLSDEQEQALQKKDIDASFFEALKRLSDIHKECKSILSVTYQRPTYEIMEMIAQHQEKAFRKLYSSVKEISKSLQVEVPDIDKILPAALDALQERPSLLSHCLDDIGDYRSRCISTSFITALTMGGPNGTPRPIEINAHDPLRYIGDMLAWIHQTLAFEFELVSTIISKVNILIPIKSTLNKSESLDFNEDLVQNNNNEEQQQIQQQIKPIEKVINASFDLICKPFSCRIEQVLHSKPSIVILYKMISLLDFYSRICSSVVRFKSSKVSEILNTCKNVCLSQFYSQIKDQFEKAQRVPTNPTADLLPTLDVKDSINRLKELITTFNTSLVPLEEREEEFKPVLIATVDPIVNLCTTSVTTSKLPLSHMAVFMINCLSQLQSVLSAYDFTRDRVELLAGQIDAHMDTLVEEQTSELLNLLGLSSKLGILQYHDMGGTDDTLSNVNNPQRTPFSQITGMDRISIKQAIRQFDTTLESSFGSLPTHALEKIQSTKLKNSAKRSVLNLIVQAYSSLYSCIIDPANQYEEPFSIFQYTPDQIKKMIS
ncbi:oligomeric Golgi complex component [Cavenderia fasciculata]|uniref:Conserved oligomeric Golgi complex subunit 6 n=1 Tax=Cavenderia fasciculata TaxID=261658 RepID=F4PTE8_CACFS|nr:oligomeric Golgi complex component [Cavenderia fasciculata]EGG21670.1 oligomeric Golgi complex component [Cavenderia fasciculata]|eukprot:XP_004359520.1 oligomeric Golgi complex component [Cavenderia fasciculata]